MPWPQEQEDIDLAESFSMSADGCDFLINSRVIPFSEVFDQNGNQISFNKECDAEYMCLNVNKSITENNLSGLPLEKVATELRRLFADSNS